MMPQIEGQRVFWNGDFALSDAVLRWLIAAPAGAGVALADALSRYLRGDWGDVTEDERAHNERTLLRETHYAETGRWGLYPIGDNEALEIGKRRDDEDSYVTIVTRVVMDDGETRWI
jgi:hypothetical protein